MTLLRKEHLSGCIVSFLVISRESALSTPFPFRCPSYMSKSHPQLYVNIDIKEGAYGTSGPIS